MSRINQPWIRDLIDACNIPITDTIPETDAVQIVSRTYGVVIAAKDGRNSRDYWWDGGSRDRGRWEGGGRNGGRECCRDRELSLTDPSGWNGRPLNIRYK